MAILRRILMGTLTMGLIAINSCNKLTLQLFIAQIT